MQYGVSPSKHEKNKHLNEIFIDLFSGNDVIYSMKTKEMRETVEIRI